MFDPAELCGIGKTQLAAAAAAWQEQLDEEDCAYKAPFVNHHVKAAVVEAAAIFNTNVELTSFTSSFMCPPRVEPAWYTTERATAITTHIVHSQ